LQTTVLRLAVTLTRGRQVEKQPALVAGHLAPDLGLVYGWRRVRQNLIAKKGSRMLSLLSLGFMVGIAHAFEADHLAAVSSLVSGKSDLFSMIRHGAIWGLGHSLTLLLVGGSVLALDAAIPDQISTELEMGVGIMLVGLGAHVFYRLHRDRVHFHAHRHGSGPAHIHLHSHANDTQSHSPKTHQHAHPDRSAVRTLAVGVMHGLAGSAALVLVAAAALKSPVVGLGYIALFGAGSILGMASITALIALPIAFTARRLSGANTILQIAIGTLTIGIGASTITHTVQVLLG